MRIPKYRPPNHPGEMLLKEFLEPMNLTQQTLAEAIAVPYQTINEMIDGKSGVTPSTALRLAKFFGNSPDFWLNLQNAWDLYQVQIAEAEQLAAISTQSTINHPPSTNSL